MLLWNKLPIQKQNSLYISKITFGNGLRGHVLAVSALPCFTYDLMSLKKITAATNTTTSPSRS